MEIEQKTEVCCLPVEVVVTAGPVWETVTVVTDGQVIVGQVEVVETELETEVLVEDVDIVFDVLAEDSGVLFNVLVEEVVNAAKQEHALESFDGENK